MAKTVSGIILILLINISISAVVSTTNNILLANPNFISTSQPLSSVTNLSFLPGISKGVYIFKIYNSLLPQIPFIVYETGLGFSGCNDIFIPCQATITRDFKAYGQASSTLKYCTIDNDRQYLQVLTYLDGYGIDGNNFYLTKSGYRIVDFIKSSSN
jgi:hypothetical protein